MPYIKQKEREKYTALKKLIEDTEVWTTGDLTYIITLLIKQYVKNGGMRFMVLCEVMGVLFCTALEFYRRVISKYEDLKIKQEGDVYD